MRSRPARLATLTLAAATLALSLAAHGDGTLPGDVRLARWLQAHPIPLAEPLTDATNRYASGFPLTALGIAIALALLAARRRDAALLVALATALRAANALLKAAVDSPRPTGDVLHVTERAHGLGFPSGHAMGATLVLGAIALLAVRADSPLSAAGGPEEPPPEPTRPTTRPFSPLPGGEGPGVRVSPLPRKEAPPSFPPLPGGEGSGVRVRGGEGPAQGVRAAAAALCLALILLTGYGRVLVGAHWPSDVLGGYLWGGCLLVGALRLVAARTATAGSAGRRRP